MLDELFGRAALKERIEGLEADNERLERQLEAERERRTEAVRAHQEAAEQVNRLEDRIAQLEGELERRSVEETDLSFRGTETVRGERLSAILDRLGSVRSEPEAILTAAVLEEVTDPVRDAFGSQAALLDRARPCIAFTDDAGLLSGALAPPDLPEPFVTWSDRVELERRWFEPTGQFALALVRSDLFALGEYEGRDRIGFRGFQSDVKGTHSKGGFSQARFERRRDIQIEAHLDRCREAIRGRDADRLYVVGQRTLLGEFEDTASDTAPVDATGEPEAALGDAFHEFWSTRLYRI